MLELQTRDCNTTHFFKYVGRLLYMKFKDTKSWMKIVSRQLCIHKIEQRWLSWWAWTYCPYSSWQLITYLQRIRFNPTGDNKAVFRLWPLWLSLWGCCKDHKKQWNDPDIKKPITYHLQWICWLPKNKISFPKGRPIRLLSKWTVSYIENS